jgi:hypothetical protein
MSDALVINYIPGITLTEGEILTIDKLNALGRPTINLSGSIGTSLVTDNSITTVKLVDGVLSADTAGRAKMADGYFSADATGRGKFAAGFFGTDATSLALFADNFWPATSAGRAKFAAGFFDATLVSATVVPVIGSTRNLLAFNNAGTPNSKVDVTADEVVLKDASGKPYLAASVSVTADVTASGANGLDTGAEAGSTWYYVWLIGKTDGSGVASLLSVSSTTPTLPATYTFKAMVGVVRNDGLSNFVTFYQQDRRVYVNDTVVFSANGAAAGNTFESYSTPGSPDATHVDLKSLVPPVARRMRGTIGTSNNSSLALEIAGDANGLGGVTSANAAANTPLNGFGSGVPYEIPLKTAQTFYWKADSTGARARTTVNGYEI